MRTKHYRPAVPRLTVRGSGVIAHRFGDFYQKLPRERTVGCLLHGGESSRENEPNDLTLIGGGKLFQALIKLKTSVRPIGLGELPTEGITVRLHLR